MALAHINTSTQYAKYFIFLSIINYIYLYSNMYMSHQFLTFKVYRNLNGSSIVYSNSNLRVQQLSILMSL